MDMEKTVMKVGTDELKGLIQLVGDGAALVAGLADGLSFSDVTALVRVVQDVGPVVRDIGKVIPAYVDLDDAERAELVAYVSDNVKVPGNATAEMLLQKILGLLVAASNLFGLFA